MTADARRCPACGEATDAVWHRRRDVPGALPAFIMRHRRQGGGWCESVRGPWRDESEPYTDADVASTMVEDSINQIDATYR